MADTFSDQSRDTSVPERQPGDGQSRALVPLTLRASERAGPETTVRPDARFVVHLIATATHAPQTRNHRRAPVEDVLTSYADTSARDKPPVAANGNVLSRVA